MGNKHSSLSSREAVDIDSQEQISVFDEFARTHDISSSHAHIENVDQFIRDLQDAIDAITPQSLKSRYTEVHVLFLSWLADDLGVEKEIKNLSDVFQKVYRFETYRYSIEGDKPGRDTQAHVGQFLREHDKRDHLLIVYYGGHTASSRQGSEAHIWTANLKSSSPTMAAGGIQAMFEESDSDVLLLYDTCHSAHPAINLSGHGVTEMIAAAAFEVTAPGVGRYSFTHALTEALLELSGRAPFSVTSLHELVLRRVKSQTQEHLRNTKGEIWINDMGRPLLKKKPTSTPIHCFLTEDRPHRGIMLTPLPVRVPTSSSDNYSISSSENSSVAPSSQFPQKSVVSSATEFSGTLVCEPTHVLLTIRVENDYFQDGDKKDVFQWQQWIKNMPPEGRAIKVEGIYRSHSTLILLRMPIALWDMLPNNPAYSFVGFVTSENKVSIIKQLHEPATVDEISAIPENVRHHDLSDQDGATEKSNDEDAAVASGSGYQRHSAVPSPPPVAPFSSFGDLLRYGEHIAEEKRDVLVRILTSKDEEEDGSENIPDPAEQARRREGLRARVDDMREKHPEIAMLLSDVITLSKRN